jgi:glycosyltransferase involved in cell wall biosynthesis
MVSVLIPAHNEEAVIGRLLADLTSDPGAGDGRGDPLEILVICNGCSDQTAAVAGSFPGVTVLQTEEPGKAVALRLGNSAATSFPRLYVDADIEIGRRDVGALVRAVSQPGVLAAAPRRDIPLDQASLPVRCWYRFWQDLPGIRDGLFGRGVIALSEVGWRRLAERPEFQADDLSAAAAFADDERAVVPDATVVVHPPRNWAALMRRRVRAVTGTRQVFDSDVTVHNDSRTRPADLFAAIRLNPTNAVRLPFFLAAAISAKRRSAALVRDNDFTTWLRDDTSREVD